MGRFLCHLADLEPTGAKGVTLGRGRGALEVVVVRTGTSVLAYENSCPHLMMTLEARPDRFLDEAGRHLVCSMHGARFTVEDGVCVWGPCEGKTLGALAIVIAGGEVRLDEPESNAGAS